MKRVCTIILNRNLPEITDKLCEHMLEFDGDYTDICVIEAGSDDDKLSKYTTWHAKSRSIVAQGLRYCRGMNYGLVQLVKEKKFKQYEAFFLLTNDTEFKQNGTIKTLLSVMDEHPQIGILSPCSERWGERLLLKEEATKYFWFIHNNAYLLRRDFIEDICNDKNPNMIDFLFDGNNFRGYGTEHELIAKAYANDWAAAITNLVLASENESHLIDRFDQIKTQGYAENLELYITEGRNWMRRKYGFNSIWSMQLYVKNFYDHFFEFHPEFSKYKI